MFHTAAFRASRSKHRLTLQPCTLATLCPAAAHPCAHMHSWLFMSHKLQRKRKKHRSKHAVFFFSITQASCNSEHICLSTCVGQHKLKFSVCWCVCFLKKLQIVSRYFTSTFYSFDSLQRLWLSSAHYRWQSYQKDCANKCDFNQPPDNSHPSLMLKQYVKSADSVRLICGKQKLIMWQSNRVPSRFKTDWGALSDGLIPSPSISCCQKRLYQSQDMCSSVVMYSKRSYFNSIQPSEGG